MYKWHFALKIVWPKGKYFSAALNQLCNPQFDKIVHWITNSVLENRKHRTFCVHKFFWMSKNPKTICAHNMFLACNFHVLNSQFHEQSVVIFWLSWCKKSLTKIYLHWEKFILTLKGLNKFWNCKLFNWRFQSNNNANWNK